MPRGWCVVDVYYWEQVFSKGSPMLTRHLLIAGLAALISASALHALTVEQTVGPSRPMRATNGLRSAWKSVSDGLLSFYNHIGPSTSLLSGRHQQAKGGKEGDF